MFYLEPLPQWCLWFKFISHTYSRTPITILIYGYMLGVWGENKKKKMALGFLSVIFIFENDPKMVEKVYLKEPDCELMWLHFRVKRHINFHLNLKRLLPVVVRAQRFHLCLTSNTACWTLPCQGMISERVNWLKPLQFLNILG